MKALALLALLAATACVDGASVTGLPPRDPCVQHSLHVSVQDDTLRLDSIRSLCWRR